MRIVGGSLGGRRFQPPPNIPARPTTDLAREALFNILVHMIDFEGLAALDLFGGTGGVSYELASRGAETVTIVEQDGTSVQFIKKTAEALKIEEALKIIRGDVFRFLKNDEGHYGLVFADPPYALPRMGDLLNMMLPRLSEDGLAVLEHDTRHSFESHPHFLKAKAYGDTIFTFFTAQPKTDIPN
jgi:16S rRNA (guanine(966)-N(2))-methyltransferase RsmD